MKYVKLIMALIVCSLMDHFSFAAETQHSYKSNTFCESGARKRIEHLNDQTKKNIEDIKNLKRDINELEAKKNIITGVQKLKDEYIDALNEVINEKQIAKTEAEVKKKSIDQFKSLLNKTLVLDAVSLMVKGNVHALVNSETQSKIQTTPDHDYIHDICSTTNLQTTSFVTTFCQDYGDQSYVQKVAGFKLQKDSIRETINHYLEALSNIPPNSSTNVDVSKILNSIPEGMRPAEILDMLKRQSPAMEQDLTSAGSHVDIVSCIEGNDNKCGEMLSQANRNNLKEQIKLKMGLTTNADVLNAQLHKRNTDDLDKILDNFDNPLREREKGNHKSLNDQLDKIKSYGNKLIEDNAELFKAKYNDSINIKNGFAVIGFTDNEYSGFIESCSIDPSLKGEVLKEKVKVCKTSIDLLSEKANQGQRNMEEEIKDKKNKLTKLLDESGKLNKIEKIKQYVQQRYIRGCSEAKKITLAQSNLFDIPCSQVSASTDSDSRDEIKSLWNSLTNTIGNLQHGNKISDKKGELGLFSKDELRVYMNYCQNVSQDDAAIKESCQEVNQFYADIANQREAKEWEEYNNKYWVEYDSQKGYIAYEKKSNLRILGEGLSQSMGGIYPIWFGNFQMENQIQMLTSQAMYQKQMMYMNSFNSPWMQQSYFQGSYFPTMPTTPATQGFNFGP